MRSTYLQTWRYITGYANKKNNLNDWDYEKKY